MSRALVPGAGLLVLLAGCPLPQPLPDYPSGTVTPPRISMDSIPYPETVVRVPSGCTGTAPSYDLSAVLVDNNTSETITVRWFVDYDRQNSSHCVPVVPQAIISGPGDGADNPTQRRASPFRFVPYDREPTTGGTDAAAPGVFHVVELVVSNRFDATADDISLCSPDVEQRVFPFRMPAGEGGVQFETQAYRWVFLNVEESPEVPCP